jgi:hypothetical protein
VGELASQIIADMRAADARRKAHILERTEARWKNPWDDASLYLTRVEVYDDDGVRRDPRPKRNGKKATRNGNGNGEVVVKARSTRPARPVKTVADGAVARDRIQLPVTCLVERQCGVCQGWIRRNFKMIYDDARDVFVHVGCHEGEVDR